MFKIKTPPRHRLTAFPPPHAMPSTKTVPRHRPIAFPPAHATSKIKTPPRHRLTTFPPAHAMSKTKTRRAIASSRSHRPTLCLRPRTRDDIASPRSGRPTLCLRSRTNRDVASPRSRRPTLSKNQASAVASPHRVPPAHRMSKTKTPPRQRLIVHLGRVRFDLSSCLVGSDYLLEPGIAPPLQLELPVLLRTTGFSIGLRLPPPQDHHLPSAAHLLSVLKPRPNDHVLFDAVLHKPPRHLQPRPHPVPPHRPLSIIADHRFKAFSTALPCSKQHFNYGHPFSSVVMIIISISGSNTTPTPTRRVSNAPSPSAPPPSGFCL